MSALFDLEGRVALITGSSRGIGYELACGLARAGAVVIVHGRDARAARAAAERIAAETETRTSSVSFDVTDSAEVGAALDALLAEHGTPDVLVNSAGMQHRASFNDFPVEQWDAVIATNLSSLFYVSQPITRAMAVRGSGKVINIGSVQSVLARQTISPYAASKGGVTMLTKGMATDLAPYGIQVNQISPGYFASDMNRDLWGNPEFDSWLRARTPAQRWGRLEELVGAAVFFASAASNFVTGQNMFVDGGLTSTV